MFVFQVIATFHQNTPWDSVVSCLLALWSCIHPASFKCRVFLSTRNTHQMQWKISHPIWLIPKAFDLKGHRKTVWCNAPLTDCSVFACGLTSSLSIVVPLSKHFLSSWCLWKTAPAQPYPHSSWQPSSLDPLQLRLRWQHNGAADGQVSENNHAPYEKQSLKHKHLEELEIKETHFLGSPCGCSAMTDDMRVILTPYSPMLKLFMGNKHHVKNRLPDTK